MSLRPVLSSSVEEAYLIANRFASNDYSQLGEPTTAIWSRGNIENTSIDVTNNKLVHSCDFANGLEKELDPL